MPAAILARFVLAEARRGGLPWLALASLLVAVSLAAFLSQVAIAESRALQLAALAVVLRTAAVFLVATQVTASTLREINDKGLELMLSLPLSRATHYLGRLAGFAACAVGLAVVFAAALLPWASPAAAALWGLSLACEAALVAAAALFFTMTLAQLVPAIAATTGLYLLARSIAAIQAIASGPLADDSVLGRIARVAVDAVALVLPRLDTVTRTDWLLYGVPGAGAYAAALGGLALYGALLVAAGLFDFHRRSV
ncbi:MAG TPA: ABC transporter permease [Burkholderiales bacterium]|nr:ABC transporter permease [Burkholderiales bacterium]